MKRVVRGNVFETNSSSQHSIIVTKNDIHLKPEDFSEENDTPEGIYLNDKGEWWLWDVGDGYGARFRFLSTFEEKFKYALCEFLGRIDPVSNKFKDEFDLLCLIAKDIYPDIKTIDANNSWINVFVDSKGNYFSDRYTHVKETDDGRYVINGDEEVEFVKSDLAPKIGSIDHQSKGLLTNFLNSHDITLKEFLSNRKYIIVIDNDGTQEFENMKYSGIYDTDNIVEEYDTSYVDTEFIEWLKDLRQQKMKKVLRVNVFETNSSAVHSLIVSKEGMEPSKLPMDSDRYIMARYGKFDKDGFFTTQEEKLSYLLTQCYYLGGWEYDYYMDSSNYHFRRIQEAICKYTGAKGIRIVGGEPYLDHQACPEYDIKLVDEWNENAINSFVFNKYIALKCEHD